LGVSTPIPAVGMGFADSTKIIIINVKTMEELVVNGPNLLGAWQSALPTGPG
jgi:hypothetical protein